MIELITRTYSMLKKKYTRLSTRNLSPSFNSYPSSTFAYPNMIWIIFFFRSQCLLFCLHYLHFFSTFVYFFSLLAILLLLLLGGWYTGICTFQCLHHCYTIDRDQNIDFICLRGMWLDVLVNRRKKKCFFFFLISFLFFWRVSYNYHWIALVAR